MRTVWRQCQSDKVSGIYLQFPAPQGMQLRIRCLATRSERPKNLAPLARATLRFQVPNERLKCEMTELVCTYRADVATVQIPLSQDDPQYRPGSRAEDEPPQRSSHRQRLEYRGSTIDIWMW